MSALSPPVLVRTLWVALACISPAGCGAPAAPYDAAELPDAAALPDLAPPPIGPAGRFDETLTVDTIDRTYILSVPQSAVDAMAVGPVPFVIALHGAGDTADNFLRGVGLEFTASRHAFVLAAPDGYNRGWFVQAQEGWPGDDGQDNGLRNDVHLMHDIIQATATSYYLDWRRLYVCGWSRGGAMTGLLASSSSNPKPLNNEYVSPFAAYAITSGYDAYGGAIDLARSSPKRPIWILHGDADQVVDYSMGESFASDLMEAGWPVTFTTVPGAGHDWLWKMRYGQTNDDLWEFFAKNAAP